MNPIVEPKTRVGLDNNAFNGRLRQPVQRAPAPPPPAPPVEGGTPAIGWTTPPPQQPVIIAPPAEEPKPSLEPPQPVWAQVAPANPIPLASPSEPVHAPEPSPLPPTEPLPPSIPEPPVTAPAPEPNPEPQPAQPQVIEPQPFAAPAEPRTQPSHVLRRQFKPAAREAQRVVAKLDPRHYNKVQAGLAVMAAAVFLTGVGISLQTVKSNHQAAAQVAALAGQSDKQFQSSLQNLGKTAGAQTAGKPDAKAFAQYSVADDLARYLEVPKLGLEARVTQTGITAKGALGTADNAYDAAWYAASVTPGKPGVVLIDGLASNNGTSAIFGDLAQLSAGDLIQIVRGDGNVINYHVVSIQAYQSDQLTMQETLTPATAGRPGLNLLSMPDTAHGGTQSVLVQAEQI